MLKLHLGACMSDAVAWETSIPYRKSELKKKIASSVVSLTHDFPLAHMLTSQRRHSGEERLTLVQIIGHAHVAVTGRKRTLA